MRISNYLILFSKLMKSETDWGELRTAIPGLDIPRKWPWLTDGSDGLEILLGNMDSLILLDGNLVHDGNRYRHPIEFNSKSEIQPFIPNLKLKKSNPSVGNILEQKIPLCLSRSDQIFKNTVGEDHQSGNNESLCYLALNSTESVKVEINNGDACKERLMNHLNDTYLDFRLFDYVGRSVISVNS